MRPTLGKWLESGRPSFKSDAVNSWLNQPLPRLKHRPEQWLPGDAFVLFKDDSRFPQESKNILWLSDKPRPEFKAQLVFNDLPKITREWSLTYFKETLSSVDLAAVTGTNGKSSVIHLLSLLMKNDPIYGNPARLGTLGLETSKTHLESPNTTPFPLDLHPFIEKAFIDGHKLLLLEASSHALDQDRLEGLKFKTVGFTNLSQDHLDYHDTMDELFEAKSKLIKLCDGTAVVNLDCPWMKKLKDHPNCLSFSTTSTKSDLYAEIVERYDDGFKLNLNFSGLRREVKYSLLGNFNISNALCALGMALSLNESGLDLYLDSFEKLTAPKGRLQKVDCRAKGRVIIDYAHTPDALDSVLTTMKSHVAEGKLKVLFGCGGNRDRAKRALMGEVAAKHANKIYLTSDNPRNENPEVIINEIESGIKNSSVECIKITSRVEAIHKALSELHSDELLMLCGKGHEQTQEVEGQKIKMCEEEICQTY